MKKEEYQVTARRYRPKTFSEVLGQESIVTILLNAIKHQRLAHAYLFCGPRGTGKTTLARILAKALNCDKPMGHEPCNQCQSCKEISMSTSLDVLEIDGASHRGIDDIRQINETVGYASSSGRFKIYLIDEVHMLTQEAFNALLKTLEEPPAKVKFFFATTEPHKLPATIISRCQRLNLKRIPIETIVGKLRMILESQGRKAEDEALYMIARRSEGCLRDAESIFEQVAVFNEGDFTVETTAASLGIMSVDSLFALDKGVSEGNLSAAFEIVHDLFFQGKDFTYFIEMLIEHYRTILLIKTAGEEAAFLSLAENEKEKYVESAKIYRLEQCLSILEYLIEKQSQIRFMPSPRLALESILLHIIRSQYQIPIEFLVRRLNELEQNLKLHSIPPSIDSKNPQVQQISEFKPSIEIKASAETKTQQMQQISPSISESKPSTEVKPHHYDTMLQFAAVELEGTIQKKQTLR